MPTQQPKSRGLRLSPWVKFAATMVVGLIAGGLRESQQDLVASEASLPDDQPFKSSYGLFVEAARTYQPIGTPPSLPDAEHVTPADLSMPSIGECPSDLIKFELTHEIQTKLAQLRERTAPLTQEGQDKHQQIREAYHDFFLSPGTYSYFYNAQSVGLNNNRQIESINSKIQAQKDQTEEEINQLRAAARC